MPASPPTRVSSPDILPCAAAAAKNFSHGDGFLEVDLAQKPITPWLQRGGQSMELYPMVVAVKWKMSAVWRRRWENVAQEERCSLQKCLRNILKWEDKSHVTFTRKKAQDKVSHFSKIYHCKWLRLGERNRRSKISKSDKCRPKSSQPVQQQLQTEQQQKIIEATKCTVSGLNWFHLENPWPDQCCREKEKRKDRFRNALTPSPIIFSLLPLVSSVSRLKLFCRFAGFSCAAKFAMSRKSPQRRC